MVVEPADGVRGEWIGSGSGPVVVYLHGGGYCIGSLTSHRAMLTHLAAATGGRVLAVDYRLAPEHPFPAALEDAVAAYRHVAAACNPSSVVVAGDSAGGGLTVATLVALRDAKVNVRLINQGASEVNIIVGVAPEDFERAVQALYDEFVDSAPRSWAPPAK